MRDKFICTKPGCGLTVYWHEDRCSSGHDVGFPNIREVSCTEEQDALQHRYENALQDAKTRGAIDTIQAFETALVSQSHCVINVWVRFLADFLNNDRILFSNYNLQVNAQVRRPTSMKDDRARRGVEGIILGSLAHNITYGALSLDGSGLISYGECAFTITDVTANARATLLEENSYVFVHHHRILPNDDIPIGYRAAWEVRHKLAIAKLANKVTNGTLESSFPSLLLFSDGDRETDEFIEIHLYGSFDNQVVEAVRIPKPATASGPQQPDLERIRDWATRNGKGYTEI